MTKEAKAAKFSASFNASKPVLAGVAFALVVVAAVVLTAFQSRFKSGYVSIGDDLADSWFK